MNSTQLRQPFGLKLNSYWGTSSPKPPKVFRFAPSPRGDEERAACGLPPLGLGPLVGARGAPQQSPILCQGREKYRSRSLVDRVDDSRICSANMGAGLQPEGRLG